jgi:hypothetical protein
MHTQPWHDDNKSAVQKPFLQESCNNILLWLLKQRCGSSTCYQGNINSTFSA